MNGVNPIATVVTTEPATICNPSHTKPQGASSVRFRSASAVTSATYPENRASYPAGATSRFCSQYSTTPGQLPQPPEREIKAPRQRGAPLPAFVSYAALDRTRFGGLGGGLPGFELPYVSWTG
ncbi:hypothetical protein ACVLV4_002969 [Rathayibacter agropyri]